jgi:capsular exopolysaccharide synthesis family protein
MENKRSELEKVPTPEQGTLVRTTYPHSAISPDLYLDGYGYGNPYNEVESDETAVLRGLWRSVCKHKWLVITITTIVTTLVAIEAMRVRPTYTASTLVEIRKDSPMLVISNSDADPANSVNINTKILMFSSRPLLEDVVIKQGLDRNSKFLDVGRERSWWETVSSLVNRKRKAEQGAAPAQAEGAQAAPEVKGETDSAQTNIEAGRMDRYISVLESGMNVEHIGETQAMRISFTHTDPAVSALVANGLAQSFMQRTFQNKTDSFNRTSEFLDHSTRQLKARVQEAEKRMLDYTRDNNIISSQNNSTLTSDKLMSLHQQAMRAEVDLLLKQSLYDEVRKGNVNQLPDAFTDPKIVELQKAHNQLEIKEAELKVAFGPEHPQVVETVQQMRKIKEQIAASHASLEQKIKSDYERAVRDNESFKGALAQTRTQALQQDQASIQYNILKQDAEISRSLYNQFLQKTNQADLEVAQQQNNVSVIRPARLPRSPDGPNTTTSILLGFLLSLGGSVGLAFFIDRFDNTIKDTKDISRYSQLPTLGIIPAINEQTRRMLSDKGKKRTKSTQLLISLNSAGAQSNGDANNTTVHFLPAANDSNGNVSEAQSTSEGNVILLNNYLSVSEAYRALRTSILLSAAGRPPKTILITSGQPGEGKTTTVINTAISLAQLGSSVLIIDADLRLPSAHKGFSVKRTRGLSTFLSQDIPLDGMIQKLQLPNLYLLPCGPIPPNPAELISSEKMREMLEMLETRFDYILIDSPPLMYVTDPLILSTLVEGVVLVVQGGKCTRDVLRQSRQMLGSVSAKILGVVLNNVTSKHQKYYESTYYANYGSYAQRVDDERVSDMLSGS